MKQLLIITLILTSQLSYSQITDYKGSALTVGLSYFELKDELNHGLVFRGPDIRLSYGYEILDSSKYFSYNFSLGGGGKTTKGTWAGTWYLSPINSHYSWNINNQANSRFYLGPSFKVQYNIQNYPELHAGSILWMTSYELGFHFSSFITLKNKIIELSLQNSLLSLNSRTPEERDPYYFTTKIGENFSDIHSNMSIGSFSQYNQTEISATIYFEGKKRKTSLGYTFNFTGYFDSPTYTQVFHQISYKWFLNKTQK